MHLSIKYQMVTSILCTLPLLSLCDASLVTHPFVCQKCCVPGTSQMSLCLPSQELCKIGLIIPIL